MHFKFYIVNAKEFNETICVDWWDYEDEHFGTSKSTLDRFIHRLHRWSCFNIYPWWSFVKIHACWSKCLKVPQGDHMGPGSVWRWGPKLPILIDSSDTHGFVMGLLQ